MNQVEVLNRYEWIVVGSFLLLLAVLTYTTHKEKNYYCLNQGTPSEFVNYVNVYIHGAVDSPGLYKVKKGTTIKEALNLAKPSSYANIEALNVEKKVRNGLSIKVPGIDYITVWVIGAHDYSGMLVVPKRTTLDDLMWLFNKAEVRCGAGTKRKKWLKDGEFVHISSHKKSPVCRSRSKKANEK